MKGKIMKKRTVHPFLSGCILIAAALCVFFGTAFAGKVTYTYDDAGRLLLACHDAGYYIRYVYDRAGNILSEVRENGACPQVDTGAQCPVVMLLGKNETEVERVRQFRTAVLAKTAAGVSYTDLYYRHARELMRILESDPPLKAQASHCLAALLPLLQAMGRGEAPALPPKTQATILNLCDAVAEKAGAELKQAVLAFRREIRDETLLNKLAASR